jgi:hypothetical protein
MVPAPMNPAEAALATTESFVVGLSTYVEAFFETGLRSIKMMSSSFGRRLSQVTIRCFHTSRMTLLYCRPAKHWGSTWACARRGTIRDILGDVVGAVLGFDSFCSGLAVGLLEANL